MTRALLVSDLAQPSEALDWLDHVAAEFGLVVIAGDSLDVSSSEARLYLLDAWHESALCSDREHAALAWAEALTNIRESRAPDEVYEQAHAVFSERELADLSITIAMINTWNRLAIGARAAHPPDRRPQNAAGRSAERATS